MNVYERMRYIVSGGKGVGWDGGGWGGIKIYMCGEVG